MVIADTRIGVEPLIEVLGNDDSRTRVPLILLSSHLKSRDDELDRRAPEAVYLTEPVTRSDLFKAIDDLLAGSAVPSERPRPRQVAETLEGDPPQPSQEARRILLAEDNAVNQMVARRFLEKRGHQVVVVPNGAEALAAVLRESFDLVVMDVQMPEMDGLQATAEIRRHRLVRMLENLGHVAVPATTGDEGLTILRRDSSIGTVVCDLMMPGMDGIEFVKQAGEIERFDDEGSLPPLQFLLMTHLRPAQYTANKGADLERDAKNVGYYDMFLKPVDAEVLSSKFAEISAIQLLDSMKASEDGERATEILTSLRSVAESLELMLSESASEMSSGQEPAHDIVGNMRHAVNQIIIKRDLGAAEALGATLKKTIEGLEKLVAPQPTS